MKKHVCSYKSKNYININNLDDLEIEKKIKISLCAVLFFKKISLRKS